MRSRFSFSVFSDRINVMLNRVFFLCLFCLALSLLSGCASENLEETVKRDFRDFCDDEDAWSVRWCCNDAIDGKFVVWKKAAENGMPEGQVLLGWYYSHLYFSDWNYDRDETEAEKWWRKAAEQGNAEGQYQLACWWFELALANSIGADVEMIKWFRSAAEQGHAKAQYKLGSLYYGGEWIPKDWVEAVNWYRKAAERGHIDSQISLGSCYEDGDGIPEDKTEAVNWYRKAAEQGDDMAQYELGRCYYYGVGVPKDEAESLKWLREAKGKTGYMRGDWRIWSGDELLKKFEAESE
jgi:TPR repeat protein